MAMNKFSLSQLVIILPLVAGVIFAVYSWRTYSVVSGFNREVDRNRPMISLRNLIDAVGEERARRIVESKAIENANLFYDGEGRLAYIIKCRHPYDNNNSDMCGFYTLGNSSYWNGHSGFRIDSVSFNDNEVLVTVHDDLQSELETDVISKTAPEIYAIPWAANTNPPAAGLFSDLIRARNLNNALSERQRFYDLGDAAKEAFAQGNFEAARKHAEDLLKLLPSYESNWNYGNAVHDANLVLGRIAITEGRIEDAKKFLIEAGRSPGSPQLNSFGPDMCLAYDLLQLNEPEIVLRYFELCRKFWKKDHGKLDRWALEIKAGKIPDAMVPMD